MRRRLREGAPARYLKESRKGTKIGNRELTSNAPVKSTRRTERGPARGGAEGRGANSTDSEDQKGYHQVKNRRQCVERDQRLGPIVHSWWSPESMYREGRGGTLGGVKGTGETDPPYVGAESGIENLKKKYIKCLWGESQ